MGAGCSSCRPGVNPSGPGHSPCSAGSSRRPHAYSAHVFVPLGIGFLIRLWGAAAMSPPVTGPSWPPGHLVKLSRVKAMSRRQMDGNPRPAPQAEGCPWALLSLFCPSGNWGLEGRTVLHSHLDWLQRGHPELTRSYLAAGGFTVAGVEKTRKRTVITGRFQREESGTKSTTGRPGCDS